MPFDITMCPGQICPIKENCLRFTGAVLGKWDSFTRIPYNFQTNQCEYFWSDIPSDDKIKNLAYLIWKEEGMQSGKDFDYWLLAREKLIQNIRNE